MQVYQVGAGLLEMYNDPPQVYTLRQADIARCPICKAEVMFGAGAVVARLDEAEKQAALMQANGKEIVPWFERSSQSPVFEHIEPGIPAGALIVFDLAGGEQLYVEEDHAGVWVYVAGRKRPAVLISDKDVLVPGAHVPTLTVYESDDVGQGIAGNIQLYTEDAAITVRLRHGVVRNDDVPSEVTFSRMVELTQD